MTERYITGAIVGGLVGLLAGCGGGGGASVPSDPAGSTTWKVYTTRGNTVRLEDQPGGGVAYDLPSDQNHPMGYVLRDMSRREQGGQTLEAHVTISGTGTIEPTNYDQDCTGRDPELSIMIQRQGDDWTASEGNTEFYRWWSRDSRIMEPGADMTWNLSLMPSADWYSVYGKTAFDYPEQFNAAVRSGAHVGVTHGGCGAAGHGVYVHDGDARVTIERLVIQ